MILGLILTKLNTHRVLKDSQALDPLDIHLINLHIFLSCDCNPSCHSRETSA